MKKKNQVLFFFLCSSISVLWFLLLITELKLLMAHRFHLANMWWLLENQTAVLSWNSCSLNPLSTAPFKQACFYEGCENFDASDLNTQWSKFLLQQLPERLHWLCLAAKCNLIQMAQQFRCDPSISKDCSVTYAAPNGNICCNTSEWFRNHLKEKAVFFLCLVSENDSGVT